MAQCHYTPIHANNGLQTLLQFVRLSGAKVNRSGCYFTGKANSKQVTTGRTGCALAGSSMQMCACINKIPAHNILGKRLQASGVQLGLCRDSAHTHTHSFLSCSDSATLGVKAEECPHFTSDWCVQHVPKRSVLQELNAQELDNQHCEFGVYYIAVSAPTISVLKDIKTRQHTTSAYSLSREMRTRINSVDQKFPLEPGHREPPKQ